MCEQFGSRNKALKKYLKENSAFFHSKIKNLLKYTLNLTDIL